MSKKMKFESRPIYSRGGTGDCVGYEIDAIGKYNCVYVGADALNGLYSGDIAVAYTAIREMQKTNLLPLRGSVAHPIGLREIELFLRNKKLGRRHWKWMDKHPSRKATGWDFVHGYGYDLPSGGYVIVNRDDTEFIRVNG